MLLASVAVGLSLSGCGEPRARDIFLEEQSQEDRVAEGATSNVIEGIDPDTTRLLWTNDGIAYFAALSDDDRQCLVVLEDSEAWSACSPSLPIQVESQGGPHVLLGDGLPDASEGWVKVADHLWTRP